MLLVLRVLTLYICFRDERTDRQGHPNRPSGLIKTLRFSDINKPHSQSVVPETAVDMLMLISPGVKKQSKMANYDRNTKISGIIAYAYAN